jgi:hypothetical protein
MSVPKLLVDFYLPLYQIKLDVSAKNFSLPSFLWLVSVRSWQGQFA